MEARELIEQWRASVPEESRTESGAAVALVGVGLALGIVSLVRRRRTLLAWAVPGALIGAGLYLLGDVVLDVRSARIRRTESAIQAELDALDPLARAQVLKSVSEQQVRGLIHAHEHG